ncbi:uncharacterized protein LAJ45_06562 [Morchella importuna]|uniref:uncharacterized protein n=1 Tax=Morchella importuna TaxID=1174673 RepID=UPI001E8D4D21|nr:uncharacterized protein LAJ45_06562 [Morchella importuna]KAH8149482.1 hypothetical protein LAJ45_06562 [Morchella importuna]
MTINDMITSGNGRPPSPHVVPPSLQPQPPPTVTGTPTRIPSFIKETTKNKYLLTPPGFIRPELAKLHISTAAQQYFDTSSIVLICCFD